VIDEIVGHKTLGDGKGGYRHEPLRRSEADEYFRLAQEQDARRKELMPDEDSARRMMFDAWLRLKDYGWKEAMYCPKDGRMFDAIEAGSSGIHKCSYSGEWPKGDYWIHSENDLWPSRPILFRATPTNQEQADE
jgi:hypothetical protein